MGAGAAFDHVEGGLGAGDACLQPFAVASMVRISARPNWAATSPIDFMPTLLPLLDAFDEHSPSTIVHARADGMPRPRIARRYRNLLLDNGFIDVTVEVHTIMWTDASCLPLLANIGGEGAWLDEQIARARDDRLFVAVPMLLASGTRAD